MHLHLFLWLARLPYPSLRLAISLCLLSVPTPFLCLSRRRGFFLSPCRHRALYLYLWQTPVSCPCPSQPRAFSLSWAPAFSLSCLCSYPYCLCSFRVLFWCSPRSRS